MYTFQTPRKYYGVTSSFDASNSNFTSSCKLSTSTSDSAAFNMFNVTSDDCFIICSCLIVCGVCCTVVICLTGSPTSSNAFFFSAVLICDLQQLSINYILQEGKKL